MRPLLLLVVLITSVLGNAAAQESPSPNTSQKQKIRVVTRNIEPFSFERDGHRMGFAVGLWNDVAEQMNLEYEVTTVNSAKEMVAALQNKTADVAVGALSITAEREKTVDFSQPFYSSGLQILAKQTGGSFTDVIATIFNNLFTWQLTVGIVVTVGVMLVISHLVWMYEHPVNEDQWPRSYLAGMGESFWWTLSIFLVGGADNKGPVGLGGRIVATVWMLASVIAVSLLTAALSAALVVNTLTSDIKGPEDLPGKKVATIGGSTAESWLNKFGENGGQKIKVQTYADIPACILALKSGEVKAVVFDAPILKYYLTKPGMTDLGLMGAPFELNNYGFGLQQDSPLRETINQVLLNLTETGVTQELKEKWFGKE